MPGEEHTHPETTHNHVHWHRVLRRDGRQGAAYWHTHDHWHETVTHSHGLDIGQEYDFHPSAKHDHAHERQPADHLNLSVIHRVGRDIEHRPHGA